MASYGSIAGSAVRDRATFFEKVSTRATDASPEGSDTFPEAAASGGLELSSLRQGSEPSTSGYVRTISNRFSRQSSSSCQRSGELIFDELVQQINALISSQAEEPQLALVQEVSDKLQELQAATETYFKKEEECEHLKEVMRELTATRAEAIRLKVHLAESFNSLQQEYYRVLRSAQLAQTASRQHASKSAVVRKELMDTQSELHHHKKLVVSYREKQRKLKAENDDLKAKLAVMEALHLADCRQSVCYKEYGRVHTIGLY